MNEKVYIIAEAGVNHNGSMELARKLVDAAVDSGVDAVKFQSFKTESLVVESASMAEYQKTNTGKEESQFKMLKRLELSRENHLELKSYCKESNITFLSTPFDFRSLEMLCTEFSLPVVKISSGDLTNAPLLLEVAKSGKDIVLSTGMSDLEEIREALGVLAFGYLGKVDPSIPEFEKAFSSSKGQNLLKEKVTLLHCTTQYPTPASEVNLNAMLTLKKEFGLKTGYSDHTMGIHIPVAAVALGAVVIEKHFTIDRTLPGPDHKASLEPEELKKMVSCIREIESALGTGEKLATPIELENKIVARKSIVASENIEKGEVFSKENLELKRPEGGMRPIEFWECLGQKAKRNFKTNEKVEL